MPLYTPAPALPWLPSDNGLLGANFDFPAVQFNNTALTAGTLYLAKLNIRAGATITNLWIYQGSTGSGASTGTFVGLYSSAGTKLTGSSDMALNFTTFGAEFALTTPQAVTAGTFVWAAVLVNLASTQPKLMSGYGSSANIGNANLAAAVYNFADNGTGLTALPASVTPASNDSGNACPFWVGYS
jgi:hypothetical protein